jgi:anti-sigma factor RsiW
VRPEEVFELEIARLWVEERVSCPHPHLLEAYLAGSLEEGPREYVAFHLQDIACPACRVDVEEIRARGAAAPEPPVPEEAEERLLASTRQVLRPRGKK